MKRVLRVPIELKECRRCGGKARFNVIRPANINYSVVRVECSCGMRTENHSGWGFPEEFKEKAAKSWNKWVNVRDAKEMLTMLKTSAKEEEKDYVI